MYCNEIRPYWLMVTKGYGFAVEDIDQSCPEDLEPYAKAYMLQKKEQDCMQHMWWGIYGISALTVAIDHCLCGKKSKVEYIKEAILQKELKNDGLTEEEIYEKELKKALIAEEAWVKASRTKGLPETIIK